MILTKAKIKQIREIQKSLEVTARHAMWGGSQRRVFVTVSGPLRNRIRLLGPGSRFSGIENLITTGAAKVLGKGK